MLCQKRRARSGRDRPDSRTCYVHQVTLLPVLLSSETGTAAYTTARCAVRYDTICYFNVRTKAERRVPELIPVLGSQLAGDVSHKPGGRLPLLSARPAVALATLKRAATGFAAW